MSINLRYLNVNLPSRFIANLLLTTAFIYLHLHLICILYVLINILSFPSFCHFTAKSIKISPEPARTRHRSSQLKWVWLAKIFYEPEFNSAAGLRRAPQPPLILQANKEHKNVQFQPKNNIFRTLFPCDVNHYTVTNSSIWLLTGTVFKWNCFRSNSVKRF